MKVCFEKAKPTSMAYRLASIQAYLLHRSIIEEKRSNTRCDGDLELQANAIEYEWWINLFMRHNVFYSEAQLMGSQPHIPPLTCTARGQWLG